MRFPLLPRSLLLVLAASLSAAGCSTDDLRATSRLERDAQGRIVLHFWNGFTGPDGKTMEAIVRRFEQANPDLDVKTQIIPWSTYYDKLTLSLAYGGAPDVFIMHAARLPEFASFDTLRALEDRYAETRPELTEKAFAPVPWSATFYQGKQFALPLDLHPIGLYYNTKRFEEAGIVDEQGRARPPTTWDGFLDAARRLTRDTDNDGRPDQWGFAFTNQRTNWITFASQFGGGIVTPDGRASAMDSPESLAASRRMRSLIYEHRVAPTPEGVDAWLGFRQGKVAMAMEGIYMLAGLEEQPGLKFAGAPAPQFGPRPGVWGGSHLLCQPARIPEDRARAAWRLMRYLSDQSLAWAKGGQVPVRRDILQAPEFQALPAQYQFSRQAGVVQYEPLIPASNSLFQFADPAIEAVLLNLQTPEAAMGEASRRINQLLRRS